MTDTLTTRFGALSVAARDDLKGAGVARGIAELAEMGLDFLERRCRRVELTSNVTGKEYFAFTRGRGGALSRPVNARLFDAELALTWLDSAVAGGFGSVDRGALDRVLYTCAMAYCAANDVVKTGDKKTPGTYFEILAGHMVAREYGTNPQRSIQVLNLDLETQLPTDFIFDLGETAARIHLPVKTSTRERVIQVWAHQRVLDGVYGVNRIRGVLVCLNETNMQTRSNSVIEVCLPGQWAIYQMFIAQLHRVYYLDIPERYRELGTKYPFIQVRPFSQFFDEADELIRPHAAP